MYKVISLKKAVIGCLLLLIAVLIVSFNSIFAEQQQSASGLQISPTRTELNVNKGTSDEVTLTLKNVTGGKIIAKPQINDFEADNNTGTPKIITDENSRSPFTIKDFISNIGDIPMNPGESKKIKIPVKVPSDQPPGGYYGVIRFIAEPVGNSQDGEGRQINLTASVAHIVLVTVPGELKEQLQIVSFEAEKDKKTGTVFTSAPDGLALGLKNSGNSFSKPFGTVSVKNFQGKEVYEYEINSTDPRGNILPGSTRVFHDQLKNISSSFGKYKAVASVSYGTGGEVIVSETTFWVIPNWLRIIAAVIILVIVGAIIYVFRKMRSQQKKYRSRK